MALLSVAVADEAGTVALAEDLAAVVAPGDVVALAGPLGAGKSAFARALIRALADDDALEVPSPTFTLVQTYALPRRFPVAHFDLYRLADPDELTEIGFDEAVREGVTLVEWPERAGADLPADALRITIADGDGPAARRFTVDGPAPAWAGRLERSRAIRALLDDAGFAGARRRYLQGDASARSHERIALGDRRAVMMNWPRRPPQPVLADGLSYPDLVHVQDDPLSFVAVAALLAGRGFRAPEVFAADLDRGLLLQEDFGSEGILDRGAPIASRYLAAAALLAEKDGERWPRTITLADGAGAGRSWRLPDYDARALLTELGLCPDWYLRQIAGRPVEPAERAEFLALWAPLVDRLVADAPTLVLRDVHSPNLLWLGGDDVRTRLGLIDIQDAMLGPAAYDLVSLATDVRVAMPADLTAAIVDAYAAHRRCADPGFDRADLDAAVAIASAQRNTKLLGGFARSALRDGKPAYLGHVPRVLDHLAAALRHPVLSPLRLWYERHVFSA